MTRSSPILYWVLGLLVLCAGIGFYNGFHTATHRDTPSWAGGSTFTTGTTQAAAPGYEPPEAQPLAPGNAAGVTPVQTAPVVDKPKPKAEEDADQPDTGDTTATPVGTPKPIALPPATTDKATPDKAVAEKPAADRPVADKPKGAAPTPPAKPKPAPQPDAPPPAQQPAVPY